MDGGIYVVLHQPLAEQYGILVVVSLPGHESDQRVLSQGDLAVLCGRAVGDHLSRFHMVAFENDGLLVVAVGLVASLKFRQAVHIPVSVGIPLDDDFIRSGTLHNAGVLCKDADAGVNRRFSFDSRSYYRSLRRKKRNGLTLHVGAHQGAVGVVILQEGDHGGGHGEYHLRRNVHQINGTLLEGGCLFSEAAGNIVVDKVSVLIQRLVCLCHNIIIFLIRRQVDNLVRNPRIGRIALIDHPVGRLHKAVLVDPRIGRQRVDQSDVGTFRRLDGAHPAVVGIMNVTHLESGPLSGKTAGTQGGKTSLVGQLGQGVVLVHKLGQLGASEELLHRRRHRLNVDQGLGSNSLHILGRHTLPYHALHSGKADAVLVLQKFSHGADPSVSKVVDVVLGSDSVLQVHIIVNGSDNIFLRNVLRHKVMNMAVDLRL